MQSSGLQKERNTFSRGIIRKGIDHIGIIENRGNVPMTYEKSYEEKRKKSNNTRASKAGAQSKSTPKSKQAAINTRQKAITRAEQFSLESEDIKVVATVNELPKVRTIKAKRNVPFPTSVVFVSVICTVLDRKSVV